MKSKKQIIRSLLDVTLNSSKSMTGRNMRSIKTETGTFDDLSTDSASSMRYLDIDMEEEWRSELIDDLMNETDFRSLNDEEKELFDILCSS